MPLGIESGNLGRFRLPGFSNYFSVGGYYWSIDRGCGGNEKMARMWALMKERYGVSNILENAMAPKDKRVSDEQMVELALETLGRPQRFRPIIRKLWRNSLVWKIKETARDLNFYRKFGKWPDLY